MEVESISKLLVVEVADVESVTVTVSLVFSEVNINTLVVFESSSDMTAVPNVSLLTYGVGVVTLTLVSFLAYTVDVSDAGPVSDFDGDEEVAFISRAT